MKVVVTRKKPAAIASEAIILPLFEGEEPTGPALRIDTESGGLIKELLTGRDFEAKPSQVSVIYTRSSLPAKRIILVGVGKRREFTLERLRAAFAKAMQNVRALNIGDVVTSVDLGRQLAYSKERIVQAVVEGALLGLYQYAPYKTVDRDDLKDVNQLTIMAGNDLAEVTAAAETAQIIANAVSFTRDLVSAPSNRMTPAILAEEARKIATERGLAYTVFGKDSLQKLGMNSLLSVASGSGEEPKFIVVEYEGGKKGAAPIVLVGKGITFDSGGICIKPAEKMDELKSDMAGGAAVLGAVVAAADLKLPINVVALIPAAENMPSGTAVKPGDVFTSYSGKTVEVINTDAEGRLILADALAYATAFKPVAIIDVATLTGACVIALGNDVTGMMGTDDALKNQLRESAQETGELVWELPLWEDYFENIKSDIADYKNYGGRPGGAIVAAAFLSKFVDDFPWVHLDIAGPSWTEKSRSYIPKGASGVGVRLLVDFLRGRAKG
jgi:leucyl aminopeptidase